MRKQIKRFMTLSVMCIGVFALTACGKIQSDTDTAQQTKNGGIVVTSVSIAEIMDKLGLELAGVPKTSYDLPERYKNVKEVGSPMSPDMEILADMEPEWVLSPASLQNDLKSKYEQIHVNAAFLDLESVGGMFESITDLGKLFDRQKEADALLSQYETFMQEYQEMHVNKDKPTVLILMGFPGSYSVATDKSYVGNLVELAGGTNVYSGESTDFISVNTEDLLSKNPDIILRTSHAMPEEAAEMFEEEFNNNDIWKNFNAVADGKVYDLENGLYGMSATLDYQEAVTGLGELFYEK